MQLRACKIWCKSLFLQIRNACFATQLYFANFRLQHCLGELSALIAPRWGHLLGTPRWENATGHGSELTVANGRMGPNHFRVCTGHVSWFIHTVMCEKWKCSDKPNQLNAFIYYSKNMNTDIGGDDFSNSFQFGVLLVFYRFRKV